MELEQLAQDVDARLVQHLVAEASDELPAVRADTGWGGHSANLHHPLSILQARRD